MNVLWQLQCEKRCAIHALLEYDITLASLYERLQGLEFIVKVIFIELNVVIVQLHCLSLIY